MNEFNSLTRSLVLDSINHLRDTLAKIARGEEQEQLFLNGQMHRIKQEDAVIRRDILELDTRQTVLENEVGTDSDIWLPFAVEKSEKK